MPKEHQGNLETSRQIKKPTKKQVAESFDVFYSLLVHDDIDPINIGTVNFAADQLTSSEIPRNLFVSSPVPLSSKQVRGAQVTLNYLVETNRLNVDTEYVQLIQSQLEEKRKELAAKERLERRSNLAQQKERQLAKAARRERIDAIKATISNVPSVVTNKFEKKYSTDVVFVRIFRRGALLGAILNGIDMIPGIHIPLFNQGVSGIEIQMTIAMIEQAYILARSWKGRRRDQEN